MNTVDLYDGESEEPVGSLKPGDRFLYRSEWLVLYRSTQMVAGRSDQVHLFVVNDEGRRREFVFHPMLMFPSARVSPDETQKPPW